MRAIGLTEFGGPEVLHVVELPDPHPGPGQVRIRVHAAGVNNADAILRDGRLADWYRGLEPPFIPGMDVAGTVDEVGEPIEPTESGPGFQVGDEVVAIIDNHGQHGGYSQYVVVDARAVAREPEDVGFVEAASFLMNAMTAHTALNALDLPAGATLLVTGAAGAVGGYAVQLAAAHGLRVIAVAGASDEDTVRGFGASDVVLRGTPLVPGILAVAPAGVDAAIDAAGLGQAIHAGIRDGGQLASVAFPGSSQPDRGITLHQVNVRDHLTEHAALTALADDAGAGRIALRVAAVFPAEDAAEAHRRFEAGGLRGRIVLQF